MKNIDTFSTYHPIVNFLYFGIVLVCTMFFMHPICLLISFISSIVYYYKLKGKNGLAVMLKYVIPIVILTAIINPAFNHRGTVILCYLPTGNPLTIESILYGIAAGLMLASVLLFFACYTEVMTSDKFVYLFGRIIPAMSLVLSMALRFVPRFKRQFESVRLAQKGIGRDTESGSLISRIKNALVCFSIMITWSLENAIDTADSMKSRGYGLKGRTAFSIYIFSERDKSALLWLSFGGMYMLAGGLSEQLFWRWFPGISGLLMQPLTISFEVVFMFLCLTPIIIDYREEKKWSLLK